MRRYALFLFTLLWAGCQSAATGSPSELRSGERQRLGAPTPELIEKAKELLEEHPDAALGTEFEFDLEGKDYVGRVETHEDAEKGRHKGITIYLVQ